MQATWPFIAKQSEKLAPAQFACEKNLVSCILLESITVSYVSGKGYLFVDVWAFKGSLLYGYFIHHFVIFGLY